MICRFDRCLQNHLSCDSARGNEESASRPVLIRRENPKDYPSKRQNGSAGNWRELAALQTARKPLLIPIQQNVSSFHAQHKKKPFKFVPLLGHQIPFGLGKQVFLVLQETGNIFGLGRSRHSYGISLSVTTARHPCCPYLSAE